MEFLCLEGTPTTIKDISAPCLMSPQTAAKQIGELESSGFISKVRTGRNTFCELSEPLMRICIEVKDNKTQHFRQFVEFLRHWFTSRELERRHAAFQHDDLIEIDPEHSHALYVRGRALIELDRPEDAIAAFDELLSTNDCYSLRFAASEVRGIGEYASARRYLDRVAELNPDNRDLWIERTRLHLDDGAFDAAAESAARIELLTGGSLLARLLAAQAAAATQPLHVAFDKLDGILEPEDFQCDERLHLEAIAGALAVSVRKFGPRYLPQGLAKLRDLLTVLLAEGVLGRILTDFLNEFVRDGLEGAPADWETAFESLASSLDELPDCRIPFEMLQVAVRYTNTGDERHLLSLPLEQRQLLEEVLPPATASSDTRV